MRDVITTNNSAQIQQIAQVKCGWITQIAWSPDGATLAVAGATGVRIYAGQFGGQPTFNLTGHDGHVKAVAFNGDGSLIASASADTTIKLWAWDEDEGAIIERDTLRGHDDSVDTVAFSDDGLTLASAGAGRRVILWDIESGRRRAMLTGHEKEIAAVAFALNGNVVFSAGWDHTIRMWDTGAEIGGTVFARHEDWVRDLAASPAGTMLASASRDGTVRLWDVYDASEPYATLYAHPSGADCVAFSPDGSILATGGRDHTVRLWSVHQLLAAHNVRPDSALQTLSGHEKPVLTLAFNTAGTLLASGSGDNTVRLWAVK